MRARWLALAWAGIAVVVWSGFYDLLITRGVKEYLMRNALSRLGESAPVSMPDIMAQTSRDGAITASLWAGFVLAAGWLTIWLARRRS
jgi:hypothetical protein